MYRLTMIIMVILATFGWTNAQELDKVFLLDSTSYTGKVVEQKPGDYIRLAILNTTDTFTFRMVEIDKLIKVPGGTEDLESSIKVEQGFNNNQYFVNLGGSRGGGDVAYSGLGIGIGYRLNSRLSLGIHAEYLGESGVGISAPYQWQKIPVMAEVRYELQRHYEGRGAIYLHSAIGYSATLDDEFQDPDTGVMFDVTDGVAFKVGLGYRVNIFRNTGLLIDLNYLYIRDETREGNRLIKTNKWSNFNISAKLFF